MTEAISMSVQGITVRYIYSACVVTTTPDVRILHDPWFTEGIYDGSWFHYPEVIDPILAIGDVDLIYVSHIHPDHYDNLFLKRYFARYGLKEVIIADHKPNHLAGKMRGDAIAASVLAGPKKIGNTTIEILPHKTGSVYDIDSAIVLRYFDGRRQHCVVNANDIVFDDAMLEALQDNAREVDILLCGYTGAGPYPQTYFDLEDPRLMLAADAKRQDFFERYKRLTRAMNAKANIPFAGKYILGGKLAQLNDHRGVADATEVLALDDRAVVLADCGGEINTADLRPSAARTERYSASDMARRAAELRPRKMDYERLIHAEEIHQLPIKRLLMAAARRAAKDSECDADYFFVFRLPDRQLAILNANRAAESPISFVDAEAALPQPRSEIDIDARYLFGLLTNVYHWNNAEVGSQYNTRRTPDEFNLKAQSFLNFLRV
jgi:UDP-MurNAc hydroxylase